MKKSKIHSKRGILSLDLVPYPYIFAVGAFVFEDFTAFDLRVPERYQDRQGGDYDRCDTYFERRGENLAVPAYVTHSKGRTLTVTFAEEPNPMKTFEEHLDALANMFDIHFDAFAEIGWEALSQSE